MTSLVGSRAHHSSPWSWPEMTAKRFFTFLLIASQKGVSCSGGVFESKVDCTEPMPSRRSATTRVSLDDIRFNSGKWHAVESWVFLGVYVFLDGLDIVSATLEVRVIIVRLWWRFRRTVEYGQMPTQSAFLLDPKLFPLSLSRIQSTVRQTRRPSLRHVHSLEWLRLCWNISKASAAVRKYHSPRESKNQRTRKGASSNTILQSALVLEVKNLRNVPDAFLKICMKTWAISQIRCSSD